MEDINKLDEDINKIIIEINQEIESLSGLSQEEKVRKNADIKSMIHYFVDETAKIEDRRTKMSDFTWQTLGLMVAAFGVTVALNISPFIKIFIYIVLLVMVLFSIIKLFEFTAQSRFRYPFLKIPEYSNRWKWFYNGNKYIVKIGESPFRLTPLRIMQDKFYYLEGFKLFVGNYFKETVDKEISDNLSQMYLLEVHNYYKNRFYLRLLRYDVWMQWTIIALIIAYIIFIIICMVYFPAIASNLIQPAK